MVQPSGTLAELRSMVGVEGTAITLEVDRTAVRLLLEAVGDDQWLLGEQPVTEAPPYLLCASMLSGGCTWPALPFPFGRAVDGGGTWELDAPIKLGDRITSVTKFKELTERQGKSGKMYFLTFETTHRNQGGELVGKSGSTIIGFDAIE